MKKHVYYKDNSKSITDTNKWGRRENFPTAEFQLESGEEVKETEGQPQAVRTTGENQQTLLKWTTEWQERG